MTPMRPRTHDKHRPKLRIALGWLIVTGVPASAAPPGPDAVQRSIEQGFASMRNGQQPGCAVGVSRIGQPDLMNSFGYADLGAAQMIDPDTSFNIGSASKQFTGFAITLLEQEGRLRVTDSIRRYLPELPAFAQGITIDHLLHHTGGVPNLELLIRLRGLVGNGTVPAATRLSLLSSMHSWNQPPGVAYEYSNTGYVLLAQIVARVSGMPFASFLKTRVFEPAGMHRTIVLDAVRTGADTAQPYEPDGKGGFAPGLSMQPGEGPSGVQSSLRDMLAWAHTMLAMAHDKRPVMRRMAMAGTLDTGETLAYGRGLRLDHANGIATIGHQGAWSSYRAEYRLFPDRRAAIVVLCNRADAAPWEQADRMARALFPGASGGGDDAERLALTPGRSEQAPEPGLYRNTLTGAYLTIDQDAKGVVRVDGPLRFPLVQERPGIFLARVSGMFSYTERYAFVPGPGGEHSRLVVRSFGEPSTFEHVAPWHPATLDRYAGTYTGASLGLRVNLESRNGQLVAHVGGRDLALEPLGLETFGNREANVFFQFGPDDRQDSFTLTLPFLRNQTFQRLIP